jgi:hypothetical protein
VAFLEEAAGQGHVVVLCYIGVAGPEQLRPSVTSPAGVSGRSTQDLIGGLTPGGKTQTTWLAEPPSSARLGPGAAGRRTAVDTRG